MDIQQIASVTHEANRAYCVTLGDLSQPNWDNAPEWQKTSAINGVKFHIDHPNAMPSASHENWLGEKIAEGWKYGEIKDVEKKEHPCCVHYSKLPIEQQVKDSLFIAVVRAMEVLL